ncbi:MAG TPA: hypothetical protein VGG63_06530 [Steroidobacteraceae bacterium]|jgi:hypothetical protein
MADPIKLTPEANAAYQAALTALQSAHKRLDEITAATPVDWAAYSAGLQTCAACQASAQTALSVYQAAILNTPDVRALIGQLKADTQSMNQSAAALDRTAAIFNKLASVANTLTSTLTKILKFI